MTSGPSRPGARVVLAPTQRLTACAAELARDTARLEALRTAAYATVREREPLADAARLLLAAAPAVASHPGRAGERFLRRRRRPGSPARPSSRRRCGQVGEPCSAA